MTIKDLPIFKSEALSTLASIAVGAVGGFGAYVIRPIITSMSPAGVALSCGITSAVASTILYSKLSTTEKTIGLTSVYPIGVITANFLGFNVRFLDPAVSCCIGGMFLVPMILSAFCCAVLCAEND